MKARNLMVLTIALILVAALPGSSQALLVYWDLDTASITGDTPPPPSADWDNETDLFEELTFYAETTVTQYDDDGLPGLTPGDTFVDNGSLTGTGLVPTNADDEGLGSYYEVTAPLIDLTGVVTDVTVDGDGITRIDYEYTDGTIELYVEQYPDADFNGSFATDDTGFDDGTLVAIFDLVTGFGHTFLDLVTFADPETQGSGDFLFQATWLLPDFWYLAGDIDISDYPIYWFINYTDYNVDDPVFNAPGDYLFEVAVVHDGSIEFELVPEPATMLLMGTGLIGLAGLGRKKFFKNKG